MSVNPTNGDKNWDFLYENNITTASDWFMTSETGDELIPKGECYSWINRSVKRK